jgi:RNA polymerase-binding transcription factor DksA
MAIGVVDSGTEGGHLAETERRFLTALERLNTGTFGLCVECQQPIEPMRIDREPLVERCGMCALRPSGQA